jgi:sulfur-oxidizing protein SoxY
LEENEMTQIDMARRAALKSVLAGGAVGMAIVGGLLRAPTAWAVWPEQAFASKSAEDAINALFQDRALEESEEIELKAPDIAENGAVVPISVRTELEGVESISIIVENNPSPLAASFELSPDAEPEVSTRIKMGKTSNVIAVVKANGKLYSTRKEVKVTIGGCGG